MPASDRNNRNYRLIRGSLALTVDEIVGAFRLVGREIGADRVRRWGRSSDARSGRYSPMADDEFDLFCYAVSKLLYNERHEQDDVVPRRGGDGP